MLCPAYYFLFIYIFACEPPKGKDHPLQPPRDGSAPPALPTAFHKPAPCTSRPPLRSPRAGVVSDVSQLPGFQSISVNLGRGQFKQDMHMFLFVYVRSEDFHIQDRNRAIFGSLPKSCRISPTELCPQMKKRVFTAPLDPNPVNT